MEFKGVFISQTCFPDVLFFSFLCFELSMSKTLSFSQYWLIPRKQWLYPDMTEKLLTVMLNQNQTKQYTTAITNTLYLKNVIFFFFTARTQKQKRQEQPRVPRSLFDRPTAQLLKLRRDAKIQKLKQGQLKLYRPMPSMPAKPIMEAAPDHPEWLIHEDWALLQVQEI